MSADPESPTENSFEDFANRFGELQAEASKYGVTAVTVLMDENMLTGAETRLVVWAGGHIKCVGLLEYGKHMLMNRHPVRE